MTSRVKSDLDEDILLHQRYCQQDAWKGGTSLIRLALEFIPIEVGDQPFERELAENMSFAMFLHDRFLLVFPVGPSMHLCFKQEERHIGFL